MTLEAHFVRMEVRSRSVAPSALSGSVPIASMGGYAKYSYPLFLLQYNFMSTRPGRVFRDRAL